jgi:hypothetical protein
MQRARALLPVLLAAIGLVVAGCASGSSSSSGAAGGGGDNNGGATVAFASPASGASVTSPVKLSFNVQGTKIGKPETGDMHLHVYVDQAADYTILYSTSGEVKVPAGQHTLKVVLAQPNHTETSTTASEQVDVTGGGSSEAPTTTASGGGGGYGYP